MTRVLLALAAVVAVVAVACRKRPEPWCPDCAAPLAESGECPYAFNDREAL